MTIIVLLLLPLLALLNEVIIPTELIINQML